MELKDSKKIEKAGIEAGTAPDEVAELNNATVPTAEEEENAGIVDETSVETKEEEVNKPEAATEISQETQPEAQTMTETGGEVDPNLGIAESSTEKMFTQSQVDEIAGKARKEGREKALRDEFARYGVSSAEELDELFGDAQRLSTLQEMYNSDKKTWSESDAAKNAELCTVKERLALLESGIDRDRYEDAKLILKGKGLEVTAENITQELATHPEWKKAEAEAKLPNVPFKKVNTAPEAPTTQINVLGNNGTDTQTEEPSEYEKAMEMFFRK